ncbi:MAG: NUDIX hydrolase N-terminal domain-containing protein [Tannerella sp.]|jgi:ADP-ribose pyrophosphatase YjhB (NUDIX family)|nr:NUDIX hydrolase N-terminal domain-containing protein [Tannerella sp.]
MQKGKELIVLAQRIRALSQTGLSYSANEYEIDRCKELLEISDRLVAIVTGLKEDEIAACYRYYPAHEYVTPKVDIRSVVYNENDEILLVREKMDGCWSLPGGWSDVGYTPKEVAVKETKEETGLDVRPVRLLAVMDKRCHDHPITPFYVYKFFVLCELTGGEFTETFDILDKGFFALDNLPPLSLDRILPEQIHLIDKLRRNPSAPVYLD